MTLTFLMFLFVIVAQNMPVFCTNIHCVLILEQHIFLINYENVLNLFIHGPTTMLEMSDKL